MSKKKNKIMIIKIMLCQLFLFVQFQTFDSKILQKIRCLEQSMAMTPSTNI